MSEFAKNVYLPMGGEERHDRRIKEDSMVLSLAVASREHEEQVSICVSECEISHAVCGPTALHGNLDLHGGGCLCIFRSHYWRYGGSIHRIYHYHFLNLLLLLLLLCLFHLLVMIIFILLLLLLLQSFFHMCSMDMQGLQTLIFRHIWDLQHLSLSSNHSTPLSVSLSLNLCLSLSLSVCLPLGLSVCLSPSLCSFSHSLFGCLCLSLLGFSL